MLYLKTSLIFIPIGTLLRPALLLIALMQLILLTHTQALAAGNSFYQNSIKAALSPSYSDGFVSQNSEAQPELQALPVFASGKQSQVFDIAGLFALAGRLDQFLSVSTNGQVSLWKLNSGKETILFPAGEPVLACAYSASRNILAVAQGSVVSLYDISSRSRIRISPALGTKSAALEFSPDGSGLLIGGEDGKVYRWRLESDEQIQSAEKIEMERYIGHAASVTALAYHPVNRMFFSADSFGSIAAWLAYDKDLFGGKYDERLNQTTFYTEDGPRALYVAADETTVLSMRVSNDGQHAFAALQDGRVEWLLVRGLKRVVTAKANKGAIYDMQISPQGKLLATIARDGLLKVWKLNFIGKSDKVIHLNDVSRDVNSITKESIGYISLEREFPLEHARKLLFLSESKLVVGETGGRLLELSL